MLRNHFNTMFVLLYFYSHLNNFRRFRGEVSFMSNAVDHFNENDNDEVQVYSSNTRALVETKTHKKQKKYKCILPFRK